MNEKVLNVEGTGLTSDEQKAIFEVAKFVRDDPEVADAFISSYNIKPATDETEKAMQLVLVSSMSPAAEFQKRLAKYSKTREFLGGLLAAVGTIFKKKEGGTKVGNMFRDLFGQPSLADKPEGMTDAQFAALLAQREKEEKEKKEAEEKKKKLNRQLIAGGVVLVIIIVVIILVVTQGRKKKA